MFILGFGCICLKSSGVHKVVEDDSQVFIRDFGKEDVFVVRLLGFRGVVDFLGLFQSVGNEVGAGWIRDEVSVVFYPGGTVVVSADKEKVKAIIFFYADKSAAFPDVIFDVVPDA